MPRPHFWKLGVLLAIGLAWQSSGAAAGPVANDLRMGSPARQVAVCHAPDYVRAHALRALVRESAAPVRDDSGRLPDEAPLPRRQHDPAGESRRAVGSPEHRTTATGVALAESGWPANPDVRAIEGFLVETLRLRRGQSRPGDRDE